MSTARHAGHHSTNHHTPDLHDDEHQDHHDQPGDRALARLAVSATLHCLTGCAIGEILGLVLATWWGWSDLPSIVLAIALAFVFGYALTIWPVLRSGLPLKSAITIALAADTLSIFDHGDRRQRNPAGHPGSYGRWVNQPVVLGQPRSRPSDRLCSHGAGQPSVDWPRQGPRCRAPIPPVNRSHFR
jgi:hypothetical protein